ncbi:hypothetical protein MKK63_01945 [Methylobacterium sp. J-088]|uniref:hypothetical protein n=1 Tax=Methylobacterium sp. J-088 TaxID=2836664 RepID=UPI001FBAC5E1|nr:hypothetical protein [Methylobacterium sp. J-088]MCJ2061475.1 hypothetical protein [Methylobacterium sp. J-088]
MTATKEIRGEVERALSGTTLPAQARQEVVTRASAVVERYASAYPHPDILRQIEQLAPGSTALIVKTASDTILHNNEIERRELDIKQEELGLIRTIATEDFSSVRQGRRYGLAAFFFLIIFSGVMYYLGAEKLSYIAFGVGSLGIVGQLITGGRKVSFLSAGSDEAGDSEVPTTEVIPAGKKS